MPDPQDFASPDGAVSPISTVDLTRTPLSGNPFAPDPSDPTLDGGQVLYHMALGAKPEDFHPALQPLAQGYDLYLQPTAPKVPGLLGSLDDIKRAVANAARDPSAMTDAGPISNTDGQDSADTTEAAAANMATRGFVNPYGRVVPVLPNVKAFVVKNGPAADRLAKQIPGLTPEAILAVTGNESSYGSDEKASRYGNYAGLHFDRENIPSNYFPGQIGVFITKGTRDRFGRISGQQSMAQFPSDTGFEASGQQLVERLKPFIPAQGLAGPKQFFEIAHEHGWGDKSQPYVDNLYGKHGVYWLVQAASNASKTERQGNAKPRE